ncbi:uncharacterized protein LOC126551123 [Aphis gossypii]|uniref:uncharacterized protein LOC126551123 n=1 Tax=Aphis gossypii TaxID=80765 RepID=UPI0021596F97|nr:uncharacterized protein LOC126551123 [Aphis gossypii]
MVERRFIQYHGSKRQRRETQNLQDYVMFTTTETENEVVDSNTTVEVYWRRVAYMSVIDSVIRNLKYRFSKESLLMASSVESFIKMDFLASLYFINHYKNVLVVDIHALKSEMTVARNCMDTIKPDFDINNISKVIEKHVYPNLYKLLQVAISIPISSATCERSFSSMRRIKNWLRTSMLQDRFTNLAVLNIERDVVDLLNNEDILEVYCTKDRKFMLK